MVYTSPTVGPRRGILGFLWGSLQKPWGTGPLRGFPSGAWNFISGVDYRGLESAAAGGGRRSSSQGMSWNPSRSIPLVACFWEPDSYPKPWMSPYSAPASHPNLPTALRFVQDPKSTVEAPLDIASKPTTRTNTQIHGK